MTSAGAPQPPVRAHDRTARARVLRLGLLLGAVLVLAACAAGPNNAPQVAGTDVAGFWLGLWHGLISPVTFVISLFTDNVNVYEVHNNGNWYDFGFILGIACAFSGGAGSGAATRRRARSR